MTWTVADGDCVCYVTSKAAVVGLIRALAAELGPENIHVNAIAPGWVMTERQVSLWLDENGERQIAQLAEQFNVNPNQVTAWKTPSEGGAANVLAPLHALRDPPEEHIGHVSIDQATPFACTHRHMPGLNSSATFEL